MRSVLRLLLAVVVIGALQSSSVGVATAARASVEEQFVSAVNGERAKYGLAPLTVNLQLQGVASDWTDSMATRCPTGLAHNPSLETDVPPGWRSLGENVACGGSVKKLTNALLKSPLHRANILGDFDSIGIGVTGNRAALWVTQIFAAYGP